MKVINLTPHAITVCGMTIKPSGVVARVTTDNVKYGDIAIDGIMIPVNRVEYGMVENLPEPEQGTIYIVSGLVAGRCKDRDDVFYPGNLVRDNEGRVIGCDSLSKA